MLLEVRVGGADQVPGCFERAARLRAAPCGVGVAHGLSGDLRERRVVAWRRAAACALLFDHRRDASRQVTEVVREVRVVARHETLVREVTVVAVDGVGQHVVAKAVDTELVDQVERAHHVAGRLRHLFAANEQEAADRPALRRFDTRRHEHRRPINTVESDDVFADEVPVDRPLRGELLVVGAVAVGGDVVGECVEPDVGDMLFVPRQGNAPLQRLSTDREILQAAFDEAGHFVAAKAWHDRVGMLLVPLEQPLLKARKAEEVVLFFDVGGLRLVDRAVAVGELVLHVVGLASNAVVPAVHIELDVAGVVARLQQFLHAALVAVFGGANEVVVLHVESLPRVGVERRDLVDELARCLARGVGVLLHLEAVFVGARQQVHVVSAESVPATDRVGDDRGVRVPEVRLGRHVIDRCRRGELWHHSNLRSRR